MAERAGLDNADNLTLLGQSGATAPTELLETFQSPSLFRSARMICDEVVALCPVTSQPDAYIVEIQYTPQYRCIESKSLKLRLQSIRNQGIFCEDLSSQICQHVVDSIDPIDVSVIVRQKSRGGIAIVAESQHARVPPTCGVYKITNKVNSKVYIGSSANMKERWYAHRADLRALRGSPRLQNAWLKYGHDSFSIEVLEQCEQSEALQKEEAYIAAFDSTNPAIGYNICALPSLGTTGIHWNHTPEGRANIAKSQLGRKHPPRDHSCGQRISAALKGKKQKPETIQKSIASRTGKKRGRYKNTGTLDRKLKRETVEKSANTRRGAKRTEQALENIRTAARTPESRAKKSASLKGRRPSEAEIAARARPRSPETRSKMSVARKAYWLRRKKS